MQNSECIEMFEKYLVEDKKASANTLSSYLRDIRQLGDYLDIHGDNGILEASAEELSEFLLRSSYLADGQAVVDIDLSAVAVSDDAAEGAAAKVRTNLAEYLEKGIVK